MLRTTLRQTRLMLFGITVLLVSPFFLPLWQIRMEAPQYKGEEALRVAVYADEVVGDIKEIDILNQYVGVRLPLEGVEMNLLPIAFGGLAAFGLIATMLPSRFHRKATGLLVVLLLAVGGSGMGVLQYRLWEMGHERGEEVFAGVDDFTPPVVGDIHVANFDASMRVGISGWLLLLATGVGAGVVLVGPAAAGDSAEIERVGIADPQEKRV